MSRERFSFAVVLPMYNEEECAERAIRTIFPVLDTLAVRTSLIAVNDGSKDRTAAIVNGLRNEFPRLTLLSHDKNRGYGGAIKTAYAHAARVGLDYVLVMDGDLTQHPSYIRDFVPRMAAGIDVIKASRYVAGGRVEGVTPFRVLFSRVGNLVARLLYRLPISDYTNGFRAMKTTLVRQFALESDGFELLMEELYQAKFLGATFAEVPYTLTARSKGDGKSTFSYKPKVLYRYLRYGIRCLFNIAPRWPEAAGATDVDALKGVETADRPARPETAETAEAAEPLRKAS